MKLSDYLTQQNLRPSAFAALLGVPPSTITRILRGERVPGLATVQRIRHVTGGAVTADDFMAPFPDPDLAEAPAEAAE